MKFLAVRDPETKKALSDLFPTLKPEFEQEPTNEEALAFIEELSDIQNDADQGGDAELSVVAGRYSINLGSTSWALLKALVSLFIALAGPDGLTKLGAFKVAWSAIKDFSGVLKILDEYEQQVAQAIAEQGGEHWRSNRDEGPTAEQIAAWFEEEGSEAPEGLQDILKSLVAKKAVTVTPTLKGINHYKIVF